MAKAQATETAMEFNSEAGIAIAQKAVAACKTREDVVNVLRSRPGNVGHKVIINLLLERAPIKSKA